MTGDPDLHRVKSEWDRVGAVDPLWAVVSRADKRGQNWNPDEFFATGEERVHEIAAQVRACQIAVPQGRALDFGCGVGRLSQALARRFDSVLGLDVAESMLVAARSYNRWPDRVEYRLNLAPDLRQLGSRSFDFIIADIVLQHLPRRLCLAYVREFVRVLRPGGVAAFQVPSGPISPWLSWMPSWLSDAGYNWTRTASSRLHRGSRPLWETHWVPRRKVVRAVTRAGGVVRGIVDQRPVEGRLKNQTYVVQRQP